MSITWKTEPRAPIKLSIREAWADEAVEWLRRRPEESEYHVQSGDSIVRAVRYRDEGGAIEVYDLYIRHKAVLG